MARQSMEPQKDPAPKAGWYVLKTDGGITRERGQAARLAPIVLVVEDDPSLRLLCRVNLELDRFHVLEAATVDRADELLRHEAVDLVLLDVHVGDRNGLELLPLLRENHPDVAVCLLTGTSEDDPPRQDGVHAFIRKPFDVDELCKTARRLVAD